MVAPTAEHVFDRIVCAVDGSPQALEAARQAERLRAPDGKLHVTAVAELDTAVHAGFAMSHVLDELDASARDALHRAVDEVRPASSELLAGKPVPLLLEQIRRTEATLVAVGPHRRSRAAGILLGGVSAAMLHDAPCTVLVAREPDQGEFPSSILVGVDGSEHSLTAAAVARALAERFEAECVIVAATGGKNIDLRVINELSLPFVSDPGRPVEALVELSQEADLLIVGSRGLHGPSALGSVSERVGHRAACSVLVVR